MCTRRAPYPSWGPGARCVCPQPPGGRARGGLGGLGWRDWFPRRIINHDAPTPSGRVGARLSSGRAPCRAHTRAHAFPHAKRGCVCTVGLGWGGGGAHNVCFVGVGGLCLMWQPPLAQIPCVTAASPPPTPTAPPHPPTPSPPDACRGQSHPCQCSSWRATVGGNAPQRRLRVPATPPGCDRQRDGVPAWCNRGGRRASGGLVRADGPPPSHAPSALKCSPLYRG